jgi:ABC-type multidrug transport system fused ATPase/permease subunit
MNTTMIVTLLGAAASDALESGQVVSGVGGQYNFVAMSHALHDARLLMMLRATHDNKDGLKSSIVWNYGHVTIPRHLRDIVITEYGVADLRGQSDSEVVKRLIQVADSRFPAGAAGKAHGKLEADWQLPALPPQPAAGAGRQAAPLGPGRAAARLPVRHRPHPDELHIVRALKHEARRQHPAELVTMAVKSLWDPRRPRTPTWNGWAWTSTQLQGPVRAPPVRRQPVARRLQRGRRPLPTLAGMTSPALAAPARAADRKGPAPGARTGRPAALHAALPRAASRWRAVPGAGGGEHAAVPGGAEVADRPGPGRRRPRRARDGAARHFLALFAVGAALGLFSALRFYMVTWLGERITADLRNAVYGHVVQQSPEFFESTPPARC